MIGLLIFKFNCGKFSKILKVQILKLSDSLKHLLLSNNDKILYDFISLQNMKENAKKKKNKKMDATRIHRV